MKGTDGTHTGHTLGSAHRAYIYRLFKGMARRRTTRAERQGGRERHAGTGRQKGKEAERERKGRETERERGKEKGEKDQTRGRDQTRQGHATDTKTSP